MTRLSQYFLPTEKQPPADAEALSHKLLVRAGMIRQVGAGLWSWLPAGWRVHEKTMQIVREELDAIGAHEMLMPVLNPAEIWRRTGRYDIDELFKLKDRKGADMVLALTHEEIVTTHVAQVVRSYRDLPLILYHFQTKGRDEARPRAGVLRTREFIMKDSYTFDRDAAGLDVGYDKHREAYDKIFDRCGLEWYRVDSDVGMMGGTGAHEYMAPCPAGENDVALAPGYAANVEVATATAEAGRAAGRAGRPGGGLHAGPDDGRGGRDGAGRAQRRADQGLPDHRRRRRAAARARPRRPPRQRHQARQRARRAFRPAHAVEFEDRIGPAGYIGPVGIDVPILLDAALDGDTYIAGANKADVAPARRPAGPRLRVHDRRRAQRSRPATPSTGTRSGSSRRSRSATSSSSARATRAARRDLPRRGRQLAADLDGLLRHRPGAHLRRRGRAVRRREGHLLAALAGAVRRAPGRARQGGHRGARARRARSTRSCARSASTSSTTTATSARARSSPTPSCSACPLRLTVGKRTLDAGEIEAQVRRGRETRSVPLEGAAQAAKDLWATLP